MTLASRIGAALPRPVARTLRPIWHRWQAYGRYFARGGRIRFDRELLSFSVSKPLPGGGSAVRMHAVVRSPREFRRWIAFGDDTRNPTYDWLRAPGKNDCLWSVGASNGLEGIMANTVSGCAVVFVEPFTPSIESLLKSLHLNARLRGRSASDGRLEVVQAAVDEKPGFARFVCHTRPVAGETLNSSETGSQDYCQGGRSDKPVSSAQWTKFVTLDELHFDHGLPAPTHLMIDVDGFEIRTLEGARRLLALPGLREITVEINDSNGPPADSMLEQAGFERTGEYVHHQSGTVFTADYFYRRRAAIAAPGAGTGGR